MMTENESVSKKERTDYQSGRHLLSDLPLNIIHIILALVPIRDAIRTSLLSRNWRYTWTSLPHLVFDQRCENQDKKSVSNSEESLKKLITNALSIHKGPIHKFEIYVSLTTSIPNMDEWLLCLSRNGIRELILDMGYDLGCSQQVHSSLYSCNKLIHLELHSCDVDSPPSTFKGFLFLKCLILVGTYMDPDDLESLVANSPLLERLQLFHIGGRNLRIRAPNLKYLDLLCDCIELYLYAPLLAEMSVDLRDEDFLDQYQNYNSPFCNYTNFFGGCTSLEKLNGDLYFTKIMSIGIESCHQSLVFNHLRAIALKDVNFQDLKQMSLVARLIIGAPNLQKLKIGTNYHIREYSPSDSEAEALRVSYMDLVCAPKLKLENLTVVTVLDITGLPSEMEFLKILLESSPVLETMNLLPPLGLAFEEVKNLRAKLLGYNLASPNFKLYIVPSY